MNQKKTSAFHFCGYWNHEVAVWINEHRFVKTLRLRPFEDLIHNHSSLPGWGQRQLVQAMAQKTGCEAVNAACHFFKCAS
jgi:hypothetical protein